MVARSRRRQYDLATEICVRWLSVVTSIVISIVLSIKVGREVRVLELVIFSRLKTMLMGSAEQVSELRLDAS